MIAPLSNGPGVYPTSTKYQENHLKKFLSDNKVPVYLIWISFHHRCYSKSRTHHGVFKSTKKLASTKKYQG